MANKLDFKGILKKNIGEDIMFVEGIDYPDIKIPLYVTKGVLQNVKFYEHDKVKIIIKKLLEEK